MKRIITLFVLLAVFAQAVPVDIMVGSRGFSMGGAYTALVDDATAAYWNPAGLGKVEDLTILNSNWILQDVDGLYINYFTTTVPIKDIVTISGSWLMAHASLEEGWNDLTGEPERTNSANDHQFTLSAARVLWDTLAFFSTTSIGLSLNRYALNFSDDNEDEGAGLGFDLGVQMGLPVGFNLGFMARNLGTEIMGVKVDPELRWGLAYTNILGEMHRVSVDVDAAVRKNRDYESLSDLSAAERNVRVFGGVEYGLILNDFEIDISGGINTLQHNTRGNHNFSAGLGFLYKKHAVRYAFGGSSNIEETLGFSHRITVSLALGDLINK